MNLLETRPLFLPEAGEQPRPLMCMNAVMGELDLDEDDVLTLVWEGRIAVAFDISSKWATRTELRIWRQSVEDFKAGRVTGPDYDEAIAEIVAFAGK